eukprot:scaffold231206_cov32-Tisochrysis_lutea.AAC.2
MAAQERAEGGCSTPNRLAGRLANMLDTALETAEWASSMLRRREPTGLLFIEKLRRQLGFLSPLALLQICCLYTTVLIKLGSSLWFFHCGCLALFTATMTIGLTSCLERPRFNFGMSAEYAMMTFGLIIASHTVLLNLHALFQPDQAAQSARLVDSFFSYLMINHGVFWAVSPCPSPTRISWLCVFLACSFSDALCHAYLLEANALIWILRGPVVLCMSAVFGRLGVMFVLARSAKLEGTMGDLRVALDTNFSSVKQLVDVENIARAWERGPLVSINSYSTMAAILVSCLHAASMVFFNEAVLMQVGILQTLIFIGPWFLRYFHTRLNSGFSRLAVFLCPVLYPLRALRDIGDIAAWLGSKSNVGWCNAEVSTTEGITLATSTNPVSCNHFTLLELSEPIMEWSIEPYLDFARGLVAATLPLPPMRRQTSVAGVALSAFTRELRRGLIVSGNIPAEVVMGAALRGVVTVLMAALVVRSSLVIARRQPGVHGLAFVPVRNCEPGPPSTGDEIFLLTVPMRYCRRRALRFTLRWPAAGSAHALWPSLS